MKKLTKDMIIKSKYETALKIVNKYKLQQSKFYSVTPDTRLFDANISTRLLNIIHWNRKSFGVEKKEGLSNVKVSDLSKIPITQISSERNAGKKTIEEFKELCICAGVTVKL